MAAVVAEFFQIMGVDMTPPSNLAELIPYLLTVAVAVFLTSAVFGVIGKLAGVISNFRRW